MNIAEVIAWKFNDQEGMCCKSDKDGILQIVKFPTGMPTKATQTNWATEYQAHLDSGGARKFTED